MKYVQLGSSGLRVAPIGVGCMSYGNPEGRFKWSIPEEEALPVLHHCYESGLNFFDTANAYSNGLSESILARRSRNTAGVGKTLSLQQSCGRRSAVVLNSQWL